MKRKMPQQQVLLKGLGEGAGPAVPTLPLSLLNRTDVH